MKRQNCFVTWTATVVVTVLGFAPGAIGEVNRAVPAPEGLQSARMLGTPTIVGTSTGTSSFDMKTVTCDEFEFGESNTQWYIYSSGKTWEFVISNDRSLTLVELEVYLAGTGGTFNLEVGINSSTLATWQQYVSDTTYRIYDFSSVVSGNAQAGDTLWFKAWGGSFSNAVGGILGPNTLRICGGDDPPPPSGDYEVVVPAAGRGSGAGGSLWVTALYIHNPTSGDSNVRIEWLRRDQPNTSPPSHTVTIAAGATVVVDDAISDWFGMSSGNGAFRVTSDHEVVVSSAILNRAGGSEFGQGFPGIPSNQAISAGGTVEVAGLKHNDSYRTNIYLIDAAGTGSEATVSLLDMSGNVRASKTYDLGIWMPVLENVEYLGWPNFDNCTMRVTVNAGSVLVGASRVNSGTGDPLTLAPPIEVSESPPTDSCSSDGRYEISGYDSNGWSSTGGYLEVANDKVETIDLTYYNMDDTVCNLIFGMSASFSPPVALATFAAGVQSTSSYNNGGQLTFTWQFNHDGAAGFAGTLNVSGTGFPTEYAGCNTSFPPLTLNGGKGD